MITSVSYSRLLDFEQCPYRVKLKYIDKVPEAKSEAADRGTAIHSMAENFVNGALKELPHELRHFEADFEALRARYKAGQVSLEGDWGFTQNWEKAEWKKAYLRMKLDACVIQGKNAIVIDYKTGSNYAKEIVHGEQCQLYTIATFLRNPQIETVKAELWYLDKDDLRQVQYTRNDALRYIKPYEKRFAKVTTATAFPPASNYFACKWCSFGPNKGGECQYGVKEGNTDHIAAYRKRFAK